MNDGDDDSADTYTMTIDVDSVPDVTGVAVTSTPKSGTTPKKYGEGEKIQITVTFDEAVTVTGDPHVDVQVGSNERDAAYESGSNSMALVFEYEVVAADSDSDGISIAADDLKLDSNDKIRDSDDNDADVTHAALGAQSAHKVDGSQTPPSPPVVSPTALVSNTGQTAGSNAQLNNDQTRLATAFTTGDNADGYTLSSVDLVLGSAGSGDNITVTIRVDSSGDPGAVHATLTNPTLANGTKTFTAPTNTTLDKDTTYWVHIQWVSGGLNLGTTASNSEDAASASGWSIANVGRAYSRIIGGFEWNNLGSGRSLRFAVSGTAKSSSTNTAPTASDGEVETLEDVAYTFQASDFNFSDTDSDDTELASVKVVSLPGSGKGTLKFDGTALAAGDLEKTVTKAELDADKLTYEPPADANGNDYTTFTFKVNDGDDDSDDAYTMTIDVDPVPDVTGVAVTSTPQSGSSPKKYGAGETIQVTVTFDETVTVTDDPHVEVEVGTNTRDADYASGSESMALVFEYTVVAADADSDGIAVNANVMLDTDSSSEDYIRDADDNDADVTFTALGAQSDHKVDGSQTPPTDNTAPTVSGAEVTAAKPKELVVTFSEALATGSVPAKTAFAVKVDGSAGPGVSTVAIDGARVKLGLAVALDAGQTSVTVDYTNPGTANDPLKDAADNEVATFSNQAVTNNAPACPDGQPASAIWEACLTVGKEHAVIYGYNSASGLGALSDDNFTLKGRDVRVARLDFIDPLGLTLIFAETYPFHATDLQLQVGATSLNLPSGDNNWGWASPGFTWTDANIGDKVSVSLRLKADADVTAPTLQSATVTGAELALTFDESLHAQTTRIDASAFTVKVGGTAVDLEDPANADPVVHDGATITLTLAAAVDPADAVTVTYTRPASGAMIRDLSGNRAASFTDQAVDHRTQPAGNNLNIRMEDNVPILREERNSYNYVYLSEDGTGHCKVGEDPNRAGRVSADPVVCPATKTYGLRLKAAPPEDVIVTLSSEDPAAVEVSPKSVTFTPSNWNDYQNITVSAVADSDGLEEHAYIYHESEGAMAHTVRVAVTDTDTHTQAGHSLVYSNDTCHCLFVQPNTPKEFTVRLRFEPEDDTWITFRVYDYYGPVTGGSGAIKYAGIKVSPARITFTPDNWETPQTFTVVADSTYDHVDPKTKAVDKGRSTTGVVMGLKPYWKQKTYPYTTSPDFRITVGSGVEFATNIPFVETIAAEAGSQAARLTWALHEDDTDEDLSRWKVRHGEADDEGEVSDWGDWSTIPGSQRDTRSHVVTGLANDTRYGFQVMPVAGDTDGFESDTATATPEAGLTLSAPGRTDLFVDGGDAQAAMSWNGLSFGGTITGWQYRYGEHNRHNGHTTWLDWTDIGDAAATSHTVTDLVNDRDYAFQVRAMAGENPGDMSEVQTAYVYHPLIERFVAAEVTDTSVGVEWGLPEGVEVTALRARYRVPEGEWQSEDIALDATGHTFTGLDPETRYNFQVVLESETGGTETGILVQATNSDTSVITGFTLVNASTDADIGALGASVSATRNGVYGIRAEVAADADIGSIVMQLSGEVAHSQTESVAPYSLYGDRNNREHGRALDEGTYTISATAYAEAQGQGDVIGTRALTFTVAVEAAPSTPVLTGFTLLDASDQAVVAALSDGAEIDLGGRSGGSFAIRADVASDATVGSVALSLTGAKAVSRTENLAPYSLYGDHHDGNGGRDLDGASLPAGTYTLSATAHAERGASGTVRGTLSVSFEVLAPAALSVADAEAEEGTDATLDFQVTLDREAAGTVTVEYATENGTAVAGSDYTATSGTLTFQPGEREKTIAVPVLDDEWDEGEETMTLRLSNAQGAVIADGEATGTITNSDPIQKMWLARFGRTVGSQVVDAVAERLGTPLAGAQVTIGGQGVDLTRTEDGEALAQALVGVARIFGAQTMEDDADAARSGAGAWQRADAWDRPATGAEARSMSERDVLLGSAFHFSRSADDGGPGFAAWGRVSAGGFDAEEAHEKGPVDMDGEVTTGIVGADAAWERWLAGVAVSVSEGEGTYAYGDVGEGALESTLTGVHPYARLEVSERVQAWGLLGFGAGRMTMRPEGRDPIETDIDMRLGAVGAQGALMEASETGGLDLVLKGDAFLVQMESAKAPNSEATSVDASRARVTLAGSRTFALGERAALTPELEVGLRHDGGDAETGTGVELGGRIAYANAGLTVEASARTLITHDDSGYEEWGASGSVRLDPGASGRGLSFTLAPTLGAASSGVERLWSLRDARELTNDDEFEAEGRLDAELGYGLPVFGAFTGTPYAGLGLSDGGRDYRLGWRLIPGGTAHDFELGVEGTWAEPANDDADPQRAVMLRGALHW